MPKTTGSTGALCFPCSTGPILVSEACLWLLHCLLFPLPQSFQACLAQTFPSAAPSPAIASATRLVGGCRVGAQHFGDSGKILAPAVRYPGLLVADVPLLPSLCRQSTGQDDRKRWHRMGR